MTDVINRYLLSSFDLRHKLNAIREQQLLDDLRQSLLDCREQMLREVEASDRFDSMDTTLTMAYIVWPRAYVIHVGNSRAYQFRGGELRLLTRDKETADHVLGTTEAQCEPETAMIDLKVGDALLLCSDAVTQANTELQLIESITTTHSAAETCAAVLQSTDALLDDHTAVVARFTDRQTALEKAQQAVRKVDVDVQSQKQTAIG